MAEVIREIMSSDPVSLPRDSSLLEAAAAMRDHDIGDVLVVRDGDLEGILTDRDIVVRGLAEGRDPERTAIGDLCTSEVVSVSPETPIEEAVGLVRSRAIRRLPVVDGNRLVGVVSLGDLAAQRDPTSALADISEAPPNR